MTSLHASGMPHTMESSRQGLQLCLRPHLNRKFSHKVMGLQSHESPNFENFETPTWESWDKMTFGCWSCGHAQKYIIRGKVEASPKSGPW
jgi:hypothetical protein